MVPWFTGLPPLPHPATQRSWGLCCHSSHWGGEAAAWRLRARTPSGPGAADADRAAAADAHAPARLLPATTPHFGPRRHTRLTQSGPASWMARGRPWVFLGPGQPWAAQEEQCGGVLACSLASASGTAGVAWEPLHCRLWGCLTPLGYSQSFPPRKKCFHLRDIASQPLKCSPPRLLCLPPALPVCGVHVSLPLQPPAAGSRRQPS